MTVTIGRRELLAALGGAAAVWPFAVAAQQAGKLPTIIATASASVSVAAAGAFRRLRNVPRGLVLENDDSNLSQNRLKRTMSTVRRVASHGAKSAPP
jgi:hypothetical protein